MKSACLAPDKEHTFVFIKAENGQQTFICHCGEVDIVVEDSQP